jgi:hypothetical protein
MLRSDLDRVGVRRAGDRKHRTIAGGELGAVVALISIAMRRGGTTSASSFAAA